MGASKLIAKEARARIIEQIHDQGQMDKSDIANLIRPHCTFDPIRLQEQAINRLVGSICRSIRDENGTRSAFIAKGKNTIVDVDTSTSLPLVSSIDEQITTNIKGLLASKKKTTMRKEKLSGQLSVFEENSETDYAATAATN